MPACRTEPGKNCMNLEIPVFLHKKWQEKVVQKLNGTCRSV